MRATGAPAAVADPDRYGALVWGVRGLVVLSTVVLAGILALGARIFVVNPVREGLRARAAGSWWLPFEPRADGSYGPLCDVGRVGTFRAPAPGRRSRLGLAVRWGLWGYGAAVFAVVIVALAAKLGRVLARIWI